MLTCGKTAGLACLITAALFLVSRLTSSDSSHRQLSFQLPGTGDAFALGEDSGADCAGSLSLASPTRPPSFELPHVLVVKMQVNDVFYPEMSFNETVVMVQQEREPRQPSTIGTDDCEGPILESKPEESEPPPPPSGTVLEILHSDPRFTRFARLLDREEQLSSDLDDSDRTLTIFAPTDAAFQEAMRNCSVGKPRHTSKRDGGDGGDGDDGNIPGIRIPMVDLLRYHITTTALALPGSGKAHTLETIYTPKSLRYGAQRIRVATFGHHISLNFHVGVSLPALEGTNGKVYAIDSLLIPPASVHTLLELLPTKFSIFALAARRTDLDDKLKEKKGISVFVPDDEAWRHLGPRALMYLFSPDGKDALERVVRYHMVREVVYQDDLAENERLRVDTYLKSSECRQPHDKYESITVEAVTAHGRRELVLERGESRGIVTDIPAANGVVHIIDRVLVPAGVNLPENYSHRLVEKRVAE